MPGVSVLIFVKYPEPGAVKTRMAPALASPEAAALHRAALLAVCESVAAVDELDVKLVVTPDDRLADLQGITENSISEYWAQGDGDLGDRLIRATDRAFHEGARAVVLLGADSPTLPRSYLKEAVTRLNEHDAVLGPCDDGGYYLLSLRRSLPVLFKRIEWGGPGVSRQTRDRARQAGIDMHELPVWYDLDRFEDLPRAARDLASVDEHSQPMAMALRRLIVSYLERSSG